MSTNRKRIDMIIILLLFSKYESFYFGCIHFVGLFSLLLRTIGGPKNSRDVSLQAHVFKTGPIQISGAVKTSVQR